NEEVKQYVDQAVRKDTEEREEKHKEGVFTGKYAVNPATGEEIPVYVSEFVLMDYGTGAIMAVPAHDQRDHDFATEHDIEIRPVVEPEEEWDFEEEAYEGDGEHINSEELNGLDNEDAKELIIEKLAEEGKGKEDVNFKLRDWLISRQRYWGTPIPIVYCEECGTVPVPEEELPVELPEDVEFRETGNPVETAEDWIHTECPECGGPAERETDTMDTFVGSSWYFLRYCSPDFEDAPFDEEEAGYWMNVDQYIGGIEHAVMHLMYARFFTKFFRDIGLTEEVEPFERLLTQGMVRHPAYRTREGEWLYPEEAEDYSSEELEVDGEVIKMSKSKKNVVDPQELMDEYGADTARLFILGSALPQKDLDWSDEGVRDSLNTIKQVHRLVEDNGGLLTDEGVELAGSGLEDRIMVTRTERAVENVTEHLESFEFNLAVDEIDRLISRLYWYLEGDPEPSIFSYSVRRLLQMMAPFTPHVADELWERIGEDPFLLQVDWPEPAEEFIDEEAEAIDSYFDRAASDVREIAGLVEEDYNSIKVIQAARWKYRAEEKILEEVKTGDREVGEIMDEVMDEGLKQYGQEVGGYAEEAVENPGKFEKRFMEEDLEEEALEQNLERLEEEFGAGVEVVREEESDEEKAERARPGKPAIVLE
ncbi:MAG: class I tRNA ligase family protein, partial [Candidatus Nanohaloarchaea archaeon]|nr:class I tRNA ligase family protein [Candidatus Nanohaloarchaea archaeon]